MPLDFRSDLDDSPFNAALGRMGKNASAAASGISTAFGALGIGLGVGSVISFGKSILDTAGSLVDASSALDITGERLQGLQAYFGTAGTSAETFRSGMTKAADSLDEIRTKDGPAREALEKLGLTFDDVKDSKLDEFLLQVSEGFSNSADKGAALTAVVGLLGKGGKQMAAGMAEGRDAIEEVANSATVMKEQVLKDFDALADGAELKLKSATNSIANFVHSAWGDFKSDLENLRAVFHPGDSRYNMKLPQAKDDPFLGPENQGSRQDPRLAENAKNELKKQADLRQDYYDELGKFHEDSIKNDAKLDELNGKQQYDNLKKRIEDGNRIYLESEKKKQQIKKEGMEAQLAIEKEGRAAIAQELAGAQLEMAGFNRANPDERRQANRDWLREQRAASREARMAANPNARDARSGAGRRLRDIADAQKAIELSDASITKLVNEIDKLILAP